MARTKKEKLERRIKRVREVVEKHKLRHGDNPVQTHTYHAGWNLGYWEGKLDSLESQLEDMEEESLMSECKHETFKFLEMNFPHGMTVLCRDCGAQITYGGMEIIGVVSEDSKSDSAATTKPQFENVLMGKPWFPSEEEQAACKAVHEFDTHRLGLGTQRTYSTKLVIAGKYGTTPQEMDKHWRCVRKGTKCYREEEK